MKFFNKADQSVESMPPVRTRRHGDDLQGAIEMQTVIDNTVAGDAMSDIPDMELTSVGSEESIPDMEDVSRQLHREHHVDFFKVALLSMNRATDNMHLPPVPAPVGEIIVDSTKPSPRR